MAKKGTIHLSREMRKLRIMALIEARGAMTSTAVARGQKLEPSSHVIGMLRELAKEGHLDWVERESVTGSRVFVWSLPGRMPPWSGMAFNGEEIPF